MKVSQLEQIPKITGSELFHLVSNGTSYKATLEDIAASSPNANGIYPDVPMNRVTIKRFSGQTSTVMSVDDNLGMIDRLFALCFPCLLDRDSQIVAYLNGSDTSKTVDGLSATLDDWTMPAMTRIGGYYRKYEYNATTNEKIFKFSVYPVKGYKYVRRRFLPNFGGCVENHDGKDVLVSNKGKWTTHSRQIQLFHTYAKNLGDNYRGLAVQDMEEFRFLFWLFSKDFNSQNKYRGIVDVTNWSTFSQASNGGQSSYAQPYQTGFLLDVAGHTGEKDCQVGTQTLKACKFLWCEDIVTGPYWIAGGGYLKKDHVWYKVDDLKNIAFSITGNYKAICEEPVPADENYYILEDFEDTLIPSKLGGSATTGLCDRTWLVKEPTAGTVYQPLLVGSASNGAVVGVSVLYSPTVPSYSSARCGGALASDDPTDPTPDGTIVV